MKALSLSVDEYLAKFPEVREIEPLIRLAASLRSAGNDLPQPPNKAAGRLDFLQSVDEMAGIGREAAPSAAGINTWLSSLNPLSWGRNLKRSVAIAAAFLAVSGGVALASTGSLPTSPLYPVKLAVEKAVLIIPRSTESRVNIYLSLARIRLNEIKTLVNNGQPAAVTGAAADLDKNLNNAASLEEYLQADRRTLVEDEINKIRDEKNRLLKPEAPQKHRSGDKTIREEPAAHIPPEKGANDSSSSENKGLPKESGSKNEGSTIQEQSRPKNSSHPEINKQPDGQPERPEEQSKPESDAKSPPGD